MKDDSLRPRSTLLDRPLGGDPPAPDDPRPIHRRGDRRGWILAAVVLLALVAVWMWTRGGSGAAVLRPSDPMLEFGPLGSGEEKTLEVELSNAGDRRIDVERVEVAGNHADDFRVIDDGCSGRKVAAGENGCVVSVVFRPAKPEPGDDGALERESRTASLRVMSNAQNGPVVVPLVGVRELPRLVPSHRTQDFGRQAAGERSQPASLTFENQGAVPMRLGRLSLEGTGAGDFLRVLDSCSGATLAPDMSCTVRVAFTPRASGDSRARLLVPSESLARPLAVTLSGSMDDVRAARVDDDEEVDDAGTVPTRPSTGSPTARPAAEQVARLPDPSTADPVETPRKVVEVPPPPPKLPELAVEPGRLELGSARLGGSGDETERFNILNRGKAPLTVRSVKLGGENPDAFRLVSESCAGRTLAPGASCAVAVRFVPGREGVQRAEVQVVPGPYDGGASRAVPLVGEGVAARAVVSAERLDFGRVNGGERVTRSVTLTNTGRAPLTVRELRLDGDDVFRLTEGGGADTACRRGGVLRPGARCTVALAFTAPASSDGAAPRRGRLVIDHDGPGSDGNVTLQAVALPAPVARLALSAAAVTFDAQPVGGRSGIEVVTLRNAGNARLELRGLRVEGPAAGDFRLVPATCDGASYVAPGGNCTVGVRFTPSASGERRARLVVETGARDTAAVELGGRGVEAGR